MSEHETDDEFDPHHMFQRPLPRDSDGSVPIFECRLGPAAGRFEGRTMRSLTLPDLQELQKWGNAAASAGEAIIKAGRK